MSRWSLFLKSDLKWKKEISLSRVIRIYQFLFLRRLKLKLDTAFKTLSPVSDAQVRVIIVGSVETAAVRANVEVIREPWWEALLPCLRPGWALTESPQPCAMECRVPPLPPLPPHPRLLSLTGFVVPVQRVTEKRRTLPMLLLADLWQKALIDKHRPAAETWLGTL